MASKFNVKINEKSRVPKYKQIVNSLIADISNGNLKVGEKIPSINELSEQCYLSRDTVEKAYKELKAQKIINSIKGKGYYTAKTDLISKVNVFFLVNKPSTYKMMIYNHFVNALGMDGHVTLSIYHCEESLFIGAIEKNLGAYDYYVIMPHFKDEHLNHLSFTPNVIKLLDKIPVDKLILLDNLKPEVEGNFGSIYQDFKLDIYNALGEAKERLKQYDKIILVYPSKTVFPYPQRILKGFRQFCVKNGFDFEVLEKVYDDMELLQSKDVYITIRERDLVNLVRQIQHNKLKMGEDIGVLSYNETPLKELLEINVITTDFKAMGETAAYMVLKNKKEKVKNVFKYIERKSL